MRRKVLLEMTPMEQIDLFTDPPKHDHGCKVLIKIPEHWSVAAEFDGPDNCYRYTLIHRWAAGPMAMIAMKNPSGASEHVGDQTVMKTARIFRRMGFGAQVVVNTCAYRHVSPQMLLTVPDPVGPGNHAAMIRVAAQVRLIVVAHGRLPGGLQRHADAMCETLLGTGHDLHVLRLLQDGVPTHPLARGTGHVPDTTDPVIWRRAATDRKLPCRPM